MALLNLKDFEDNELILVLAPSDRIQEVNVEILKNFLNKKDTSCIYVTVAKPYKTIIKSLEKNGIKPDKLFFVDCATGLATGNEEVQRSGNAIFCPPQMLSDISIAMSNFVDSIPKKENKTLILDTLSTLMLYNNAETVGKFMHAVTGKLRNWGVKSVILTMEEETDKEIISQISQFVDKVVKI